MQRAVDWITAYQRFDDAEGEAPTGWPYDKLEMCWGRHTCHMGAVKALKALAEIPPARSAGPRRLQGRRPGPLEAPEHLHLMPLQPRGRGVELGEGRDEDDLAGHAQVAA